MGCPRAHQEASVVWIGLTLTGQDVCGRKGGASGMECPTQVEEASY